MAFEMRRVQDDLAMSHEINVTPFIDVMLVLLIIFMIAVPMSAVHVPLDLPVTTAKPATVPHAPVVLSVGTDLKLTVDERPVPAGGLRAALDAASAGDRGTRVFLRADKAMNYGDLMRVMDQLREAGYLKVALVARAST
jgi:biopolymer transport protein ExbD